MTFKILLKEDYEDYLDHVKENMSNCRVFDANLLTKIKDGLYNDSRILIFAEVINNKIVRSVMTKKRRSIYEYIIVNIRSSTNFFNKKKFLSLFNFIFNYYEKEKYYKWVLSRPLDLLNPVFFNNLYAEYPFSKYETAIEAYSGMANFNNTLYNTELLSNIPDQLSKDNFVIISGFCKQQFRTFDEYINKSFV